MLQELTKVFRSQIKTIEILSVIYDLKPVARILVKDDELKDVEDICHKNNLLYLASDFKVAKDSKTYSEFSIKINEKHKGTYVYYIGKKPEQLRIAKEAEAKNNHKALGIALGYPECCINHFTKYNASEIKNPDLTLESLDNSKKPFNYLTNIAARHFDISLLSHFPCSFSCEESAKQAKKKLELLQKLDSNAAKIIKDTLNSPIIYTHSQGIFILKNAVANKNLIEYKEVLPTVDNQLNLFLKQANKLEVHKDKIKINGLEIKHLALIAWG